MVLRRIALMHLLVLLLAGCGAEKELGDEDIKSMLGQEQLKETVPVSGKVLVKGAPAGGVNVIAYSQASGRQPALQTRTREDGTYCWTTYKSCDGIQPGEYQLAFTHIPKEGKGKKEGEDLFQGKYRNPTKNNISLVVKSGEPQVDVNYELE